MSKLIRKLGFKMTSNRDEGFTLLEILVAIGILAFGLLAIATMQATAIKGNAQAIGLTEGVTLIQDRIEELISRDYDHADLADTDGDGTTQDTAPDDGVDDDGGNFGLDKSVDLADECANDPISDGFWPSGPWDCNARYRLFWNIAVGEPINNVKTIRVIVEWDDRGTRKRATVDFMKADVI